MPSDCQPQPGSRTPETNGSHIGLQRLHQWIEHRRVGVIAQAPGRCLTHEGIAVDLKQLQQGLHGQGEGLRPNA